VIDLMDHYIVDHLELYFRYVSDLPNIWLTINAVQSETGNKVTLRRQNLENISLQATSSTMQSQNQQQLRGLSLQKLVTFGFDAEPYRYLELIFSYNHVLQSTSM
jgi:hypothetical protein